MARRTYTRRPKADKPKTFADLTEAEIQALDGERRRAVELERAALVAEAVALANRKGLDA